MIHERPESQPKFAELGQLVNIQPKSLGITRATTGAWSRASCRFNLTVFHFIFLSVDSQSLPSESSARQLRDARLPVSRIPAHWRRHAAVPGLCVPLPIV